MASCVDQLIGELQWVQCRWQPGLNVPHDEPLEALHHDTWMDGWKDGWILLWFFISLSQMSCSISQLPYVERWDPKWVTSLLQMDECCYNIFDLRDVQS